MELIKIICDVLAQGMDVDAKRIHAYNQKWPIPPDSGLFMVVGFLGAKPFGNNRTEQSFDPVVVSPTVTTPGGLAEVQTLNVQETYWIDVFSKDESARARMHEVNFAMMSTYSQQLSEKYSFQLAGLPLSFIDTSASEGSSMLTKYTATFVALRAYSQTRVIEYFDKFQNPPQTLLTNP